MNRLPLPAPSSGPVATALRIIAEGRDPRALPVFARKEMLKAIRALPDAAIAEFAFTIAPSVRTMGTNRAAAIHCAAVAAEAILRYNRMIADPTTVDDPKTNQHLDNLSSNSRCYDYNAEILMRDSTKAKS
jgi:hypothetical protein